MSRRKLDLQVAGIREEDRLLVLIELLNELFDVSICDDPELLIFSSGNLEHYKYECTKIYHTVEKDSPNFDACDYSFSYDLTSQRNFQYPNFIESPYFHEFLANYRSSNVEAFRSYPKTKFCNFMYSNPIAPERIEFCKALQKRKYVDCPGKVLNNMERVSSKEMQGRFPGKNTFSRFMKKIDFLKQYRFTIAFENSAQVGYTTEKLYHPLVAGSVPIYWGDTRASVYFNPDAFINAHDFNSWDELSDYVVEVDSDPKLYEQYSSAEPIVEGSKLEEMTREHIKERLTIIVEGIGDRTPVSQTFRYRRKKAYQLIRYMTKRIVSRLKNGKEGTTTCKSSV